MRRGKSTWMRRDDGEFTTVNKKEVIVSTKASGIEWSHAKAKTKTKNPGSYAHFHLPLGAVSSP